ncbi:MAG: hypothetical protein Q9208_006522 [Pyrenodesmia sp. 3 TL-2023]
MLPPPLFALFFLLLPTIDATPQLSPNGIAPGPGAPRDNNNNTAILRPHVRGRPNPVLPDPCGPPFGQPGNAARGSKSTCGAQVSPTRPFNDPFHLQCQLDSTGYTMNWDTCRRAIGAACTLLTQATNPTRDAWVWAPVFTSTTAPALNCSVAFWLPTRGALAPDTERCRDDIFARMIEGCETAGVNVASVNLKRLPRRTRTERFTGEAWDPGYPSYLIVAQNWVQGAET